MPRPRLSPATVAVVMLLGAAGGALASSATEEEQAISTVLNARTSISQAIAAAEQRTGGLAVKVDVAHEKGGHVFKVNIVTGEERSKVYVDPASGDVRQVNKEGFFAKLFDMDDLTLYSTLRTSPIKLASAISTAEKETGGKAFEAEFRGDNDKRQFEVETARNKVVQKVKIDAATGKIVGTSKGHDDSD